MASSSHRPSDPAFILEYMQDLQVESNSNGEFVSYLVQEDGPNTSDDDDAASIPRCLSHSVGDMTALHEAATLPESMLAVVNPCLSPTQGLQREPPPTPRPSGQNHAPMPRKSTKAPRPSSADGRGGLGTRLLKLAVHIHTCAKSVHRYTTKKRNVKMMHNISFCTCRNNTNIVLPYDHPHTFSERNEIMYVVVYQAFLHIFASMKHAYQSAFLKKNGGK